MFYYDSVQFRYAFKNELLPLSLSSVRNVLISQGFLIPLRDTQGTRFYISPTYDALVAKHCKERRKQLSLEQLKKQFERNELAGEKAELFVLEYEKRRLGLPLCEKVRRISEIDVTAGYDIVSFDSPQSREPDRFIEVKAVSSAGFYWSKNEYEIAKLKGDMYYLLQRASWLHAVKGLFIAMDLTVCAINYHLDHNPNALSYFIIPSNLPGLSFRHTAIKFSSATSKGALIPYRLAGT